MGSHTQKISIHNNYNNNIIEDHIYNVLDSYGYIADEEGYNNNMISYIIKS